MVCSSGLRVYLQVEGVKALVVGVGKGKVG